MYKKDLIFFKASYDITFLIYTKLPFTQKIISLEKKKTAYTRGVTYIKFC